ncbi:MAG: hypothetical protein KDC98_18825 [Planctomycetes bacterium]|nr:hypothetical protein [Planctomycetota bacterium]
MLLASCTLAACNSFEMVRFSNCDLATAAPVTSSPPPAVYETNNLPNGLPPAVAYASVRGNFHESYSSLTGRAKLLLDETLKRGLAPDYIVVHEGGSQVTGAVSNYIGFGMSIARPIRRSYADCICYRLAPVALGLMWDDRCMVLVVDEELRAECAIQEGDTVMSIGGLSVRRNNDNPLSDFDAARLALRPGQSVEIVWIRPGTGRMSDTATLRQPPELTLPKSTVDFSVLERKNWDDF